jgi:hypothetical protein
MCDEADQGVNPGVARVRLDELEEFRKFGLGQIEAFPQFRPIRVLRRQRQAPLDLGAGHERRLLVCLGIDQPLRGEWALDQPCLGGPVPGSTVGCGLLPKGDRTEGFPPVFLFPPLVNVPLQVGEGQFLEVETLAKRASKVAPVHLDGGEAVGLHRPTGNTSTILCCAVGLLVVVGVASVCHGQYCWSLSVTDRCQGNPVATGNDKTPGCLVPRSCSHCFKGRLVGRLFWDLPRHHAGRFIVPRQHRMPENS